MLLYGCNNEYLFVLRTGEVVSVRHLVRLVGSLGLNFRDLLGLVLVGKDWGDLWDEALCCEKSGCEA